MEYVLYVNDKEHKVKLKDIISMQMRGKGVDLFREIEDLDPMYKLQKKMIEIIQKELGNNITDVGEDYKRLLTEGKIPPEALSEITQLSMSLNKLQPETEKQIDLIRIELFKLLLDMKSIPTDVQEAMKDKEFWDEQDWEGIVKAVNSFRERLNIKGK